MLRLLSYLIQNGVATNQKLPESLEDASLLGFPSVKSNDCKESCSQCISSCPTDAISKDKAAAIVVDRGACITCAQCIESCPEKILENDLSTSTYAFNREDLLISAGTKRAQDNTPANGGLFKSSFAVRVVSTGCSACDLELSAASNPIFDIERFGVHVVASPRYADALIVTGPVPKAMHLALKSCYDAMSDPRIVIACGTCAISGGVHKHGYAEANGVGNVLPVDLYIPGCPPHPLQLIRGILAARKLAGRKR